MEFVENITKQEFEKFVSTNHIKCHFMQSYYWGEINKKCKPHHVGIKKDGKIIATALLLEEKILSKYCFFYCPRGFVCDYENTELLENFTNYLKQYCKKRKGIFLRIDPDIKLQNLDSEGNILDGLNNHELVRYLIELGYKHKGFNNSFENFQPRYTFRLDISKGLETFKKHLLPSTRKIINQGNIHNIQLYRGNINDLDAFYDTLNDTSKREHPKEYYHTFYTVLNKQNMSDIYIAKINIAELKKNYKSKIDLIEKNIELANVKGDKKNKDKVDGKLTELNQQLTKCKLELEKLKSIKEKELVLCSVITVKYQHRLWAIHSATYDKLRFLNANYLLYYKIIEDAIAEHYKLFDFFGTIGKSNTKDDVYNLHLFKQSFGGEYTEFIGEFDYVLKPILYFGYTKFLPKIKKLFKR